MTYEPISFVFPSDALPERLDTAVARACDISRTRIQKWLEKGCVTLNGVLPTSNHVMLQFGDVVDIVPPQPEASHMKPVDLPLDIVWEDDHILVVNKPAGLTVHPGPGHVDDTLINALLHHCGDSLCSVGDVERPGLVHRLDQHTSGLMVVAKTDAAYQGLIPQFQTNELKRTYRALVFGRLKNTRCTVDASIGRHPKNRQKQAVVLNGKVARTHIQSLSSWCLHAPDCWVSEWECKLETGRTHQIRVHAAHIGYPLVGDPVYGRVTVSRHYPESVRQFPRQALYAVSLALNHPVTGDSLSFEVPPPQDYMDLVSSIQSSAMVL